MKKGKLLGILLTSAIALGGCADEAAQREVIVEVKESELNIPQMTEVTRGNLQVVQYYDAQVGPRVEQLTFSEEDTFGEFYVQLGDTVQKGDILAAPVMEGKEKEIENKEKELESLIKTYDYKKASLENEIAIAGQELENVYSILETLEYMSPEYTESCKQAGNYHEQRQRLELQLKQLQETHELELPYYRNQLKKLREESEGNMIRAPFDGTIVALAEAEYGDAINRDLYYVALADTSVDYARCENISSSTLKQLDRVLFLKDGQEYEATSIPMDNDYYRETQNNGEKAYLQFELSDENEEVSLGDCGMLKFIFEEKENVLLIPELVLQSSGRDYYVYKDVDGGYEKVMVKIGDTDGINVEIVEGLEEGDVVYVQE